MGAVRQVVFAHGKESGPWGSKILALAEIARACGYGVLSPDYSDLPDAESRVARLLDLVPENPGELILVGSSMGGYVSLAASRILKPQGLFLLAPAVGLPGYGDPDPVPIAERSLIVHAWQDEIVPAANVIDFSNRHRIELHLLNSDHRLISVLPTICLLFRNFLRLW
ncbi:alpha/beta fold hydrolase [Geoalkalibacter halelectricus]|uniref:alpha/beta fold hydrolase n=1 Tax=Geoalkalibacter halelectricus TaxID=2847045 RepID=UPI003D21019C